MSFSRRLKVWLEAAVLRYSGGHCVQCRAKVWIALPTKRMFHPRKPVHLLDILEAISSIFPNFKSFPLFQGFKHYEIGHRPTDGCLDQSPTTSGSISDHLWKGLTRRGQNTSIEQERTTAFLAPWIPSMSSLRTLLP